MKKPNILVLKTDGTNCDEELAYAFTLSGGDAEIVHINELRSKKKQLKNYQIIGVPGGFSYGDNIVSGKILAVELTSFFADELKKIIERKNTLIIGICNGFQILVRTGLLPFRNIGQMDATLTNNDSGHFECRWINLKTDENTKCVFLKSYLSSRAKRGDLNEIASSQVPRNDNILSFQVAHGEGKFFALPENLKQIEQEDLVAFRYVNGIGKPTQNYPANPNGSLNAIAGITDTTGRILGLMPHPERFVKIEQHPNWRRMDISSPQGLPIFKNMISYVKQS